MDLSELEKKLNELMEAKKTLRHKFTRKTIDAINKSEEISLTHMSLADVNDPMAIKAKRKFKKKKKSTDSSVAVEEPEEKN